MDGLLDIMPALLPGALAQPHLPGFRSRDRREDTDAKTVDNEEDPDIEQHRRDDLQNAEMNSRFVHRRPVGEQRLPEKQRRERRAQRERQANEAQDRGIPNDPDSLQLVGAKRQALQQHDERRDDTAREAIADIDVALERHRDGDDPARHKQDAGGALEHAGIAASILVWHQRNLPLRSRLMIPRSVSAITVISPIVSNPRKSARITVTIFRP